MARTARSWLARACLVSAALASVAGCGGMPDSGPPGTFGATAQDTTPDLNFIGAVPAGPAPDWSPAEVVAGFLNASASYPAYSAIAKQYLVDSAREAWDPGWSVKVVDRVNVPDQAYVAPDGRHATVDVWGTVRASFDGTGQYVAAQDGGPAPDANQRFYLVKVDGEWRIANPPYGRLLTEPDFSLVYRPQDLYFIGSGGQVLVPDSVFVPTGTSSESLVSNLVGALLKNPQTPWLQAAPGAAPATTAFPGGSSRNDISVSVEGTTATVTLSGAAAKAGDTALEQISAQLVWTLTGQQESPANIQAVELVVNGKPWVPSTAPCPGGPGPGQSPALKLAMYGCYSPYPAVPSASFYYVGNGQAWARCAPESQVTEGSIGPVVAVFSQGGAAQPGVSCAGSVLANSAAAAPSQPRSVPPLSMVAVSPDRRYAACVSPGGNVVDVWAAGGTKPSNSMPASGVTALSWDQAGLLWVAKDDETWTVTTTRTASGGNFEQVPNSFGGKIAGLSIAPDGVRVAAIAQTASGPQVELAAISRNVRSPSQLDNPPVSPAIGSVVRLGPNITNPIALTWYDADNLLVLDHAGSGTTLWEVPVDGQPAVAAPGVPADAVTVAADSPANALVVGRPGGKMAVSASLEGPWQLLGNSGQNPVFPAPAQP